MIVRREPLRSSPSSTPKGIASPASSPTSPAPMSLSWNAATARTPDPQPHPHHQGHRAGQPAVRGLRAQRGLARARPVRPRPDRLDPTAMPRRLGRSRTQDTALPAVSCRRLHRPPRLALTDPAATLLAMDTTASRRVRSRLSAGTAGPGLTAPVPAVPSGLGWRHYVDSLSEFCHVRPRVGRVQMSAGTMEQQRHRGLDSTAQCAARYPDRVPPVLSGGIGDSFKEHPGSA